MNAAPLEPATIRPRALLGVLLLAIGLSWPWLGLMDLWPMATDTGPWIERGDPAGPDWINWVFHTRHFKVGYRPVTALSFSLGSALAAPSSWMIRGTDCAVHLASVLCLWALLRRVLAARPGAAVAALVGMFMVLAHPAVEEVVPFSARRSYSLALLFACAGLLVGVRVAGSGPRSLLRSLCSGLLLVLALFSNEVASVAILFLPALRWLADRSPRSTGRRLASAVQVSLLPAALVGLALYFRWTVIGGIGGYVVEESAQMRATAIWLACWRDLAGFGFLGHSGNVGPLLWAAILLLGLGGASRALAAEGRRWSAPPLIAAAWILAYGLLFSTQKVWYSRQAYSLLPALGLVFACLTQALVAGRGRGRGIAGVAALLTASSLLLASPTWRGLQPERQEKWALRQHLIEDLLGAGELELPARVVCVLPFRRPLDAELKAKVAGAKLPRDARQPVLWANYLLADKDVKLEEFLYIFEPDWNWTRSVAPELEGQRPGVNVPLDRDVVLMRFKSPKKRKVAKGAFEALPSAPGPPRELSTWLFLYGPTGGELTPVGD
ncbi:MAG: hypothetical protein ACI8QC_001663 [Planctomycetota bacterium]|jgi:hypothetical protein